MTFQQAVAELRAKYPKSELSPSAVCGGSFNRAARVDFKRGKGGVYEGRDTDKTEVLVYYNDTELTICCTEVESWDE
ncbi:hypothetical protein [Zavarzinella formosa]|uniref:hypothetical protein n=1 Tax=Zavarzinella formosa TaxID=360055 RepID=UPI000319D0D9|nr:hypothetical protein [Zavarzinella formosa]